MSRFVRIADTRIINPLSVVGPINSIELDYQKIHTLIMNGYQVYGLTCAGGEPTEKLTLFNYMNETVTHVEEVKAPEVPVVPVEVEAPAEEPVIEPVIETPVETVEEAPAPVETPTEEVVAPVEEAKAPVEAPATTDGKNKGKK